MFLVCQAINLLLQVSVSPIQAVANNLPRYEKNPTKALVKKLRTQLNQ